MTKVLYRTFMQFLKRTYFFGWSVFHFDSLILDAVDDDSEDGPPLSIDEFL